MDKLMDNPWFIKIMAILLAVLLYSAVPNSASKTNEINVPGENTTETLVDIPVKAYFDTENLVVTGIPDMVDVTIEGPMPHVQSAKALKNFEVFVDITNAKIGDQKVTLEVSGLSEKLKATIKPSSITVAVQEKVTSEFTVEAEFDNDLIKEGYSAGQPAVKPNKVKITGAKDVVDRITYVKAALEGRDLLESTVTKEAQVQVLDKELNKLDVVVEPEIVEVTIPIKSNTKTVPINILEKGTPQEGLTIESMELDVKEAVISGDEDVLKDTENVRVEVDVSKISENTTLTLPVIISNGITKVTPETVKVTVVVNREAEKTVSDVPIKIRNLPEQYEAVINDPANRVVNLFVFGPGTAVTELGPSNFDIFIDLNGLTEGVHNVNIQVNGPPNVKWEPDKSSAKITITRDNA
ncbi:YbbR-like domain-containing protein [Bacillus sp. EB106-08-02-XG196]|uniref:CdaR family protein n=1 Tax=Bacillus sp. EB106-08-02-XG196 TaxID=2737049 RepID=UPI0015C4B7A4|nr:CdaR family protein [Bacillus sp. EB106-08-02-XG196]NWQ44474.1 YbbR-like domain-containing protein [Bacillus sp. EB106-08-02-XG196]